MTILAMVNAEKEGQIESKLMKARQMEEIREAKKKEAEARQQEKKSKLVRWTSVFIMCWETDFVNNSYRKRPRSLYAERSARATMTPHLKDQRASRLMVQSQRENGRASPLLKYCIMHSPVLYSMYLWCLASDWLVHSFVSSQKRHICHYHEKGKGFYQKSIHFEILYNNDI